VHGPAGVERRQDDEVERALQAVVRVLSATLQSFAPSQALKGHKETPKLVAALRLRDQQLGLVKNEEKVAQSSIEPPLGFNSARGIPKWSVATRFGELGEHLNSNDAQEARFDYIPLSERRPLRPILCDDLILIAMRGADRPSLPAAPVCSSQ
jgi:hypothetical protein